MPSLYHPSIPLKLAGAVLALALIAAIAVAVTLTAGPTQAQSATNTYTDPQPCGPGAGTASMDEPHERTTGHYALFDAYWERTESDSNTDSGGLAGDGTTSGEGVDNTGILHTNTCPPTVTQTIRTNRDGTKTTTTSYDASGVDIDELIIHVTDFRKVAVVATNAEVTAGQLSLEKYRGLREALGLGDNDPVEAGTEVWWVRTDDPSTSDTDESNGLSLGFSTRHLDDQYWARQVDDGNGNNNLIDVAPLHYAFEVERNPGIPPADHPHVLNYRIDHSGTNAPKEIWNSVRVHAKPLEMEPGEYEGLEWIFTKSGTYEISAHLIGWVNHIRPSGDAGRDWVRISDNETETSEVKTYTIQVGNDLDENEPPVFGLNFTLPEDTPAGTLLGGPIRIHEADADKLFYTLSGAGREDFALEPATNPHSVQIKVADGASIDFETRSRYEFHLNVTDKLDHESNENLSIDDFLSVIIDVEDIKPSVSLEVSNLSPAQSETVTFRAVFQNFEEVGGLYKWELIEGGHVKHSGRLSSNNAIMFSTDNSDSDAPRQRTFTLKVVYNSGGNTLNGVVYAQPVTVTWAD